ncbi:hypothetical protein ACF08Z_20425, partial [Streptomyces althioticus]
QGADTGRRCTRGSRTRALNRGDPLHHTAGRHPVLLDAGESIKAVSEYLGHSDPGLTLRVYAHIMPSSQERTRKAVDSVLGGGS